VQRKVVGEVGREELALQMTTDSHWFSCVNAVCWYTIVVLIYTGYFETVSDLCYFIVLKFIEELLA
jgi:hypothetical protein